MNYRTNNGSTETFTVDSKNQLNNCPIGVCSYDGNGNLTASTSPGNYTFIYDDENRLTSVRSGTSYRTDFIYDGLGRMRYRLNYTWTGSSWTSSGGGATYVYDGMRVIQERDGSPTVSYTRGSDLSGSLEGAGGIGGLLARSHGYASSNGNWYTHNCYHADGNGNVTYLVDSSQAKAAAYRYDPFGNTISSSGSLASAHVYRFSSKEIHVNGGLYYYGFRWYAPNLQRWLNRDPLGEGGFEALRKRRGRVLSDGANLYTLVGNSPIDVFDLFGLAGGTHKIGGPCCLRAEENWKLMGYPSAGNCINNYDACYSTGKIGSATGLGGLLMRGLGTIGKAGGLVIIGTLGGAALTGWEGGLALDSMFHCLTSTCVEYGKIQPDKSCK